MRWSILFVLSLAATACLRTTEFKCQTSGECGAGGVCEATGYCSLVDATCGQRYAPSAGPYAGQCVGGNPGDGGVDIGGGGSDGSGSGTDASIDAGNGNCPSGYNPITGLPHLYKLLGANDWTTERTACAQTSASAYLAIPDDAAELMALDTLVGAGSPLYWVGIDDLAVRGTFVTVKGGTPNAALYAPTEPNNGSVGQPKDCISAIQATALLQADRCSTNQPAVCECEP